MAETKTIKGQCWIENNCLVQEQILLVSGVNNSAYNTIVLIEDIWADLTSASGTYKFNNKKDYFYWEVEMTDTDNEDNYITVKYECPKPKEDLFIDPETKELYDDDDVEGEYSKYWLKKIKQAIENSKKSLAIQRKEVTFSGTQYIDQTGQPVELEDTVFKNNDLGDISNLLSLF